MRGEEFFREVDEAVRQDRWLGLWQRYGSYIAGGAIAIILGTAAGVGWRQWQEHVRAEAAQQFAEAAALAQRDQMAEAALAFSTLAEETDGGYHVLARLRAAAAEAAAGDEVARDAKLQALAEDDEPDELYQQLSALLLLQGEVSEVDPSRTLERLEPLTEEGRPWRYSALELTAIAQLKSGATADARRTLEMLAGDPQAPAGIVRRAAELLESLGGSATDLSGGDSPAGSAS